MAEQHELYPGAAGADASIEASEAAQEHRAGIVFKFGMLDLEC